MKKRTVRLRSKRDPAAGSGKQRTRQSQADLEWFTNALDVLIAKAAKRQLCPVCVIIELTWQGQYVRQDLFEQGATDDDLCRWLNEHGLFLPPELDAAAEQFADEIAAYWRQRLKHAH